MRPRLLAVLLVSLSMPLAAAAAQQRVVSGTVADSTGRPVPYVNVEEGGVRRGLTNASGEFRFQTNRKGSIPVGFRRLGYQYLELRVASTGDTTLSVVMQPVATQLATTVVSATARVRALESRGFYSRFADREKGILGGEFVTPEDIQLRNPMRASQLLEQRNGVQVRRIGNCEVTIRCWAILGAGGCSATVYLDGRRMNSLASASLGEVTPETVVYVDELVSPMSIAGVEVYPRGVRAPPEYQSLGGSCAIVVIWTR